MTSDNTTLSRRIRTLLIVTFLCLAAAECAARIFWYWQFDVPLLHPGKILYSYYSELRAVDESQPSHHDGYYNILFLGGSVLNPYWSSIEQTMDQDLNLAASKQGHRKVRIFNLAEPAHTSRDSLLKYAALDKARFDLVIVYDGINDVRANNVPPGLFRDNYDHYSWYQIVNVLSTYSNTTVALPYTLHYIGLVLWQRFHDDDYIPTAFPRAEWTTYGKNPLTVLPFQHNIESIINMASQRKDHVLLVTFAIHVPKDYTWRKLWEGKLDYASANVPVEIWGEREHVETTLALHNSVIRNLAAAHPDVHMYDMALALPRSHRSFNDPCHLTAEGSVVFATLLDKLIEEHW